MEKIEVGTEVIYKDRHYKVYFSSSEKIILQSLHSDWKVTVPFYSFNSIKHVDGYYY